MVTEPQAPLDDADRMLAVDARDMRHLIRELPEQYETALGIARSFAVEPEETKPSSVFITGVGDSGLAADMAAAVLAGESEVPVISSHGERLPKHVGEGTLVFVVDYTGKSPSEMRNLREAKHRGARVICVTTGGKLVEEANKEEVPIIKIPPGQPARTAIGYLFAPLVATIEKLDLVQGQVEQLSHAIKLMKNVREIFRFQNSTARNLAKQTAEALFGRTIAVYGARGYRAVIAERWKRQIAASAKIPALTGSFPDFASGEISGWESRREQAENCAIVLLRDRTEKGELAEMIDAAAEVLEPFHVVRLDIRGATAIEKLLYGMYLGDYVSYYLALLREVDPSTTEFVSLVEEKLIVPEPPVVEAEASPDTAEPGK